MDLASVLTLGLLALYLAAQPWAVLAAVLLVSSHDGVKKNVAFASGWLIALAVVAVVTVAVYPSVPQSRATDRALAISEVVVGVAIAGWLLHRWRRPVDPGTPTQPKWMGRLDGMSLVAAFALGAFLPTYLAVVAAVSEMLNSGLRQGRLAIVAAAWVLLASAGVAAPLAVVVRHPDQAAQTYDRWRAWIIAHSRAVLFGVGWLVCGVLVAKGAVVLAG